MHRTAYANRHEAGEALAAAIVDRATDHGSGSVVVLGLARGGVAVAAPVAAALHAPLDVVVVRKLGLPSQPELAMGALAAVSGRVELVRNDAVLHRGQVSATAFDETYDRELALLRTREATYRTHRAPVALNGRVVYLVDDGLATGTSMRAALAAVRRSHPARIVVAVPVGARDTALALGAGTAENADEVADDVIVAWLPEGFHAVGQAYLDFAPTTDDDVCRLLAAAAETAQT